MQQLLALPPQFETPESTRWQDAEEHAFQYGQAYDSYFTTEPGWKRFWGPGRSGVISYRRMGRYVKCVGGLLAHDDDKPLLLRNFVRFAESAGLYTSFYNVTESDLDVFRKHRFQITKWGEEPFVDLQACTWSGKPFEWVRRQSNYCRRAGITVIEYRREEMDDASWQSLMRQLRQVSDELLATKSHAHEVQLVEGQLEVPGWGRRRLFVAYSQGSPSRIEGFVIALPMMNGRQWSFEMYRHRVDAIRGVVPHLFHEAMIRMKKEGAEAVSLCLIPGLGCEGKRSGDNVLTRVGLSFGKKHLNFLFDFAGLYHFKSRFRPRYESRYICSRPRSTPMSTLVFFRMSGMLTFSPRKVGKNFIAKHLKRSQRKQLAGPGESLTMASCQSAE